MRFERLQLVKYGHFTGRSLDLAGDEVLLHIVHGRNESGKSTILSAIADLLFGIHEQTTFNFLHDNPSLEIGATIVSQSGARLSFKRLKRREKPLYSQDGVPLPDGALVPFLGDADRGTFENKFGLDHERLREAGDRMMEKDGDLGRSLFEAGSGLGGVDGVVESLQGELDGLGTPARNSPQKPLWRAAKLFKEFQKAKYQLALRHGEFRAADTRFAEAAAERAKINEDLATIRERRSRLERIRRAGPILADIERLARELSDFADVPDLPAGFEAGRLRCFENLRAAETAVETARRVHESLARELEAISDGDTLTQFAPEIGALQTRLGEYLKGIADETKLADTIGGFDEEIIRHGTDLGLALAPGEVGGQMPKAPLTAKIRAEIRSGDATKTRQDKAKEDSTAADLALAAAEAELLRFDAVVDASVALSYLEAATRMGDVTASLAERRLEASKAARDMEEAAGRLDGWSAGLEALAATPFPSSEAIRDYEQSRQKIEIEKDAALRRLADASADLRDVEAGIQALEAAGEIPTAEAVAAARNRRDTLWRLLRRRKLERLAEGEARPSEAEADADLVGRYETSVRQADELADRRASEAQRIARFAELTGQRERLSRQAEDDRVAVERLERALDALAAEWSEAWAEVGMKAEAPAAVRAFLAAKDEALRRLGEMRRVDENLARARGTETRVRELLVAAARELGLSFGEEEALDTLDQRVRASADAQADAWKKRQDAEKAVRQAHGTLRDKRSATQKLEGEMQAWMESWSGLVREVSCPDGAGPGEAEAVLQIWDRMRDPVTKRAETLRRLKGLREDNARYRRDVEALIVRIAALSGGGGEPSPRGEDCEAQAVVPKLGAGLEAETLQLARRADVGQRYEAAGLELERAKADLESARIAFEDLRRLQGLDDQADLADLGRRAAEKRAIVEAARKRREELVRAGDGFDEDSLREQCRVSSPDVAEAEVAALLELESDLVRQGQGAAQEETSATQALDTLHKTTGAAEADAKGRDAALAFAGHAERWLLLETARQLLIRAVERYRVQNEDPMLTRASELLARIAAGAENPIIRLGVEYRDKKVPEIVCRRRDSRSCKVKHMSEGTRDQLFLCLRIAAIELYAKEREPLPFIADDLFVTSDDDRVVPGLAALAELGRTTQVLLFTHHRHVVEAARTLPPGTVRLHELAELRDLATEPASP